MIYKRRNRPARGVLESESYPTLVFVTACTKGRNRWLANPLVHTALRASWCRHTHWMVGPYVIMPDHVHFFAEPGERPLAFDDWVKVWKSGATRILKNREWRWQAGCLHHRIRSHEDHSAKRIYMDENPVRAGLVKRVEDWPYRGELFRRFDRWP
jgi:putative transposase